MLLAWAMRKFKRFRAHKIRASRFLQKLAQEKAGLSALCSIAAPSAGATTVATSASQSSLKAMESARPTGLPRENTV
jgi:hypothetical protein